jgi:hypothetical protein
MIANDAQLATAIAEVSGQLQDISDYLKAHPKATGQVRFPRGVLRTAAYFRSRFPFIADNNLLRNLSYAFMLYDVFNWILTRTDLAGTARDMVLKNAIVLIGSIAESLARGGTAGIIGAKHNYKERTRRMVEAKIIAEELKDELDWLWDMRSGIHIYLMEDSEYDHYRIEHFDRAQRAARDLRDALDTYHAARAS